MTVDAGFAQECQLVDAGGRHAVSAADEKDVRDTDVRPQKADLGEKLNRALAMPTAG